MDKYINQLIKEIKNTKEYKDYLVCSRMLENPEIKELLLRNKRKQEEYQELKKYNSFISNDELRDELKEIKKEMQDCEVIQNYLKSYQKFNALLTDVAKVVFQNISDDLQIGSIEKEYESYFGRI